jgi:hypothetical protein
VHTFSQPGSVLSVRIEAESVVPIATSLELAFVEANRSVNAVFFELLPEHQLHRFGVNEVME